MAIISPQQENDKLTTPLGSSSSWISSWTLQLRSWHGLSVVQSMCNWLLQQMKRLIMRQLIWLNSRLIPGAESRGQCISPGSQVIHVDYQLSLSPMEIQSSFTGRLLRMLKWLASLAVSLVSLISPAILWEKHQKIRRFTLRTETFFLTNNSIKSQHQSNI